MKPLAFSTLFLTLLFPRVLAASSSGLNNIPTADTALHLTMVFQEYSFYKSRNPASHTIGFKFGLDPWSGRNNRSRFEIGLDGYFGAGPAVLQAKWAFDTGKGRPSFSIGTANVAGTASARRTAGQPFSFAVVTEDLGLVRLHGGYALQGGHNNTALLGADRTIKVLHRDLMFRADAVQTAHQDNWETSFGAIYGIHRHFAVESWISQPLHGGHAGFMVKLDFVIP